MCIARNNRTQQAPQQIFAAPDNSQANQTGTIEAALRRRRAGAAADIFTSPMGIPAVAKLGGRA